MHISTRISPNPHYEYHFNENPLEETTLEKDLGVYVTPDWKNASHVAKAAAKANSMVGQIRRTFNYMDVDIFKAVYPSMIRSHMEYAVQAWSPHLVKDILILENVQRRATKLVTSLRDKTYEVRKLALDLTSLAERRERGDLIQVFKIMHGYDNLRRDDFFVLHSDSRRPSTRGHSLKILTKSSKTVRRRKYFDIRIINKWNELSEKVVCKQSVSSFKTKLDHHFELTRGGTSTSETTPLPPAPNR